MVTQVYRWFGEHFSAVQTASMAGKKMTAVDKNKEWDGSMARLTPCLGCMHPTRRHYVAVLLTPALAPRP